MYPKILALYGPLELNSYNAAILLGIVVFFVMALRDKNLQKHISKAEFFNVSIESAIAAIIGARLLHVLSQWKQYTSFLEMISIWNGGLSILGALLGIIGYSIWALRSKNIPVLPVYDIAALYAPLVQGIARIGCFLVGCCYGAPTALPWGVGYHNPLVLAPLNITLHPTQLYSSLIYLVIFILLYKMRNFFNRPGKLCLFYIMAMSFERWFVDFFRGDRILVPLPSPFCYFSFYQWIACGLFLSAFLMLWFIRSQASLQRYNAR